MEFLVQIQIDLPTDLAPAEHSRLIDAERTRGQELVRDGSIVRIWRVGDPSTIALGHLANVGVWEAPDERGVRELLGTLPLFPWMTADILRRHPLEET